MKNTRQKSLYWAKQIAQTLVLLLLISLAVDWWRSPTAPLHAADTPFTTMKSVAPTTLAAASAERTLVLYFWGSWCGICKHTSPVINDLHTDGVPVLGVALRSGSLNDVRSYLAQNQLAFDTINDERGELSRAWNVKVTPTIVLIKNGKIIHSTTGFASYWGLKTRIWASQFWD